MVWTESVIVTSPFVFGSQRPPVNKKRTCIFKQLDRFYIYILKYILGKRFEITRCDLRSHLNLLRQSTENDEKRCVCFEVPKHFLLSEPQPPALPGLRESVANLQNPFLVASLHTHKHTHKALLITQYGSKTPYTPAKHADAKDVSNSPVMSAQWAESNCCTKLKSVSPMFSTSSVSELSLTSVATSPCLHPKKHKHDVVLKFLIHPNT